MNSRTLLLRITAGLGLVAMALGVGASPAGAHAELIGTEPAAGSTLDEPPSEIVLDFSETVEPPGDAISVYGSSGDELDVGDVRRPDGGKSVGVDLPEVDDGAYVVTWKVTSADSHPIRGGFTFRVGAAAGAGGDEDAQALMDELLAGQGGDKTVGFLYGVVRFFGFAGMVLLVGGAAFVAFLWPAGAQDRRDRRLVGGGWVLVLVTTLLSFGLQGAYAAGDSLGSMFDPSTISDVLETRAGRIWVLRLVLLAVVFLARRWLLPPVSAVAGVIAGLALLSTISFAGHAASGDLVPLALVTDVAHLSAISFWVAGLTLLTVVLLRRRESAAAADADAEELQPVVSGFSAWAAIAVVVIVVSGTIQGIRQTQGIEALFDTTYGRLLLIKVALFLGMFGAAVFSRTWVQKRWPAGSVPAVDDAGPVEEPVAVSHGPGAKAIGDPGVGENGDGALAAASAATAQTAATATATTTTAAERPTLSGLRRSVGIEAALAVVVLAVTALLVNTVPGRESFAPNFAAELHTNELLFDVEVEPAKAGITAIRVETLTHGGEPLEVLEVTGTISLPARDIAPIPLALEPVEGQPGVYVAADTDIPFPGDWQLDLSARLSEFDETGAAAQVPIK